MSITMLNADSFRKEILEDKKTVLVEYMAPWCVYCRRLGPTLDKVAAERDGSLIVAKLDIDECPKIAEEYKIEVVPTILLYKDGKEAARIVNPASKALLDEFLSQNL